VIASTLEATFVLRGKRYNDEMKIVRGFTVNGVVETLNEGKVVVVPTDTVYGLIADATNQNAVEKVFLIKKRDRNRPLSVFVKDLEMAQKFAKITKEQEEVLQKKWPGRFTAVLQSRHMLSEEFEEDGKIGLRIPDDEFVLNILEKFKKPLTGTSANISDMPSCWSAEEVVEQFTNQEHQPDLILDAGALPKQEPSRVVDLTEETQRIIR